MKILTKKQLDELELKPHLYSRSKMLPLCKELSKVKIGQYLYINNDEWKKLGIKSSPGQIICQANRSEATRGMWVQALENRELRVSRFEEGYAFYFLDK